MRYYLTTPIYYVNSAPAHRPRVHDDRCRHPGPAPPPARGRDLLPHRHGRERVQGLPRRRGAGARSEGVRRRDRREHWRALPERVGAEYDFFIRTTDEGHHRFVQEFLQRIYDNGDIYQDVYAACTASAARSSRARPSSSTACAPSTGSRRSGSRRGTSSSACRRTRSGSSQLYDERPDFVLPHFRYNEARSFIEGGLRTSASAARASRGACRCRGTPSRSPTSGSTRLINYLSALTYARPARTCASGSGPTRTTCSARTSSASTASIWPALLLAAGYEVPKQMFVHGWLLWTTGRSRSRSAT